MKKASTILKQAKEFLEARDWTKGSLARDKEGFEVGLHDRRAASFCATGAISRCSSSNEEANRALFYMTVSLPYPYNRQSTRVADFNDHPRRNKKQILALFDRAILRAVEAEQLLRMAGSAWDGLPR